MSLMPNREMFLAQLTPLREDRQFDPEQVSRFGRTDAFHVPNGRCVLINGKRPRIHHPPLSCWIFPGERVSGKGADLYEMCDEVEAVLRG